MTQIWGSSSITLWIEIALWNKIEITKTKFPRMIVKVVKHVVMLFSDQNILIIQYFYRSRY